MKSYTVVACLIIGSLSSVHGKVGSTRSMQTTPACGTITGFSVYNAKTRARTPLVKTVTSDHGAFDRIILEDFPNGLNIEANVQRDNTCQVKCVKLEKVSAIIRETPLVKFENFAPYELFSTPQTPYWGTDNITATSYGDANCVGTPYSTDTMQIQFVVKRVEKFWTRPLTVLYNGTSNSVVTASQTSAMVRATCNYMKGIFQSQFTVQDGAISLTDYTCWRTDNSSQLSQPGPLAITYRFGTIYTLGPISVVEGGNRGFITLDFLTQYFQFSLLDLIPFALCWGCEEVLMSAEIKRQIGPTNPYSLYDPASTMITVTPYSKIFNLKKFVTVYDGTDASVGTNDDRNEIVTAICQFMVDTVIDHFKYDGYRTAAECKATSIGIHSGHLQVTYQVTPTYSHGPVLPFPFFEFPEVSWVVDTVKAIFIDEIGITQPSSGDGNGGVDDHDHDGHVLFLSAYIKQMISPTNPYGSFTKIIVK
jgi:hypothetical protein